MGTPGKVVRAITDEDVTRIQHSVTVYQRNWRRFKAGMVTQPE